MNVLVYLDSADGRVKKPVYEAISYAKKIAQSSGGQVHGLVLGASDESDLKSLGKYGLDVAHHVDDTRFNSFDSRAYSMAVGRFVEANPCAHVVFAFNHRGKALAPRVAARLDLTYVPGAMGLPSEDGTVIRGVNSGKAFAHVKANKPGMVLAVTGNAAGLLDEDSEASISSFDTGLNDDDFTVKVVKVEKMEGGIVLTEADRVVSAGRGLKGPENWGMIEELADTLNAATACSRPVSDVGWRPHHEHVGQTGITVRPNLYFAIGISGAIQHLAGVNQSRTIVVINTDPEAPFFKAADYGVVGDAFDVVPKLNAALKAHFAA